MYAADASCVIMIKMGEVARAALCDNDVWLDTALGAHDAVRSAKHMVHGAQRYM